MKLPPATISTLVGTTIRRFTPYRAVQSCQHIAFCIVLVLIFGFLITENAQAQLQGGAGNVRVNIVWSGDVDLDLYVTDPCGNSMGYGRNSRADCRSYTGEWDHDDTGHGDRTDNPNAENIVWSNGAPIGRYQVHVNYFAGAVPTNYTVRVFLGDREQPSSTHQGTVGPEELGRLRHVTDFEADESVNLPVINIDADAAIDEGGAARFRFTAIPPPAAPLDVVVNVAQTGDFVASDETGRRTVTIGTDGTGILSVRTVTDAVDEDDGSITVSIANGEGYTGSSSASVTVRSVSVDQAQNEDQITYRLCARDDQREDGDDVNIFVNGVLIFDNYYLRNAERCETIILQRDPTRNSIRVQAISVGTPPFIGNPPRPNQNSAALRIRHATDDTILEGDNWLLNAGGQQLWDIFAISENEVSLVPRERSSVRTQAVQGTVAAVAAATVANVTSNIGARFSAPSGGSSVSLAGMPITFGSDNAAQWSPLADRFEAFGDDPREAWQRTMSESELMRSSSFEIALGAAEGSDGKSSDAGRTFTVWGRGDFQMFESGGGRKAGYDGDLVAGYLGADFNTKGGWLIGLAVSRIASEADYTVGSADTLGSADGGGKLEADLTNVHPYVRFALGDRTEAWTILGLGTGEVEDTSLDGSKSKSDLSMRMLAAGARHLLNTGMGIDLAVIGDGSLASVETEEGVQPVDGISANVWRARLGMEASYTKVWEGGSSFTPFVEVAARKDGGDSAEGIGLEVSPGLALNDPGSGLSIEARGRALALHSADNHREYGASITARLAPGSDGLGLSIAVTPTWGMPDNSLGSMDASLFPREVADSRSDSLSLNSRIAYGLSAGGGILAPFAELALHHGESRRLRIGSRYSLSPAVDVELFGSRSDDDPGALEHIVGLNGRIRF